MAETHDRSAKDSYVTACFYIQKELHESVTKDYPMGKFLVAIEEMNTHNTKEEAAMKKNRRG